MSSRDSILGTIRDSLKKGGIASMDKGEIEARLTTHARNTVPARAQGDIEAQTALFIAEAQRVEATTGRLDSPDDVAGAVMRYLASHNLPGSVRIAPHPTLKNINWSQHPTLEIAEGRAEDADQTSLSVAATGVAETGSLVLHSGPQSPTTLNFMPDNHIVLLPQAKIIGSHEEAWTVLRESEKSMPRTVNWVTGPSRSADIEQTLLLGAHGPVRLHILILND